MRLWLLAWAGAGLLFVGCSGDSQPDANGGNSERRFESSRPAEAPEAPVPTVLSESQSPVGASQEDAAEPLDASSGEVKLDALTLTAPDDWVRKPTQSSFVEAEFALPKAEGDDADGRLTVSIAGGSVEANIDRWKDQFVEMTDSKEEKIDAGGLEATLVDFSGVFNDQRGPFTPAVTRSDYRMIAAVIPVGQQLHFVKATGPQKTIEAHAEKIKAFVRSAKPQ